MTTPRLTIDPTAYQRLALSALSCEPGPSMWDWSRRHFRIPGRPWDAEAALLWYHFHRLATARLRGQPDPVDPFAHRCEQLYICAAAQVWKTTWLHNLLYYAMACHPRKMALFMSRLQDLKEARQAKLEPTIDAIAPLADLLPQSQRLRERALGSTLWQLGASMLFFKSGCVADDWRAQDFPLLILDEIEQYPINVENQGDPIDLGLVRQRTHRASRLLVAASSPGSLGGHTWTRTCSATHERLLVDCPTCAATDWLDPRQVTLTGDHRIDSVEPDDIKLHDLGRWACAHCGELHDGAALRAMVVAATKADYAAERPDHLRWCPGTWDNDDAHPQGLWAPHADFDDAHRLQRIHPAEGLKRSAQLNSLYSPIFSLSEFAAAAATAHQGTEEQRITWRNVECAEPYVLTSTAIDADAIHAQHQADYQRGHLPHDPAALIMMIDQQGNQWHRATFPWVLIGVDYHGETWRIDMGHAKGHDAREEVEDRLWPVGGRHRAADLVWMDSANGNVRFQIYAWAAGDLERRRLIRGDARLEGVAPWEAVVDSPTKRARTPKPEGVQEWRVAPHYWRSVLWDRIRGRPGQPAWHLPSNPPDWYLRSLTSEEQITEVVRVAGGGYQERLVWRPRVTSRTDRTVNYRKDNHWWDDEADLAAIIDICGFTGPPPERDLPPPIQERENAGDWLAGYAGGEW